MAKRLKTVHFSLVFISLVLLILLFWFEANSHYRGDGTAVDPLTITFSHPTSIYQQAITLRLAVPHPDAQILFTTDGSLPLPGAATVYTHSLHLPADPANTTAVRARAFLPDGEMGPIANASYFMGIEASVPVISLLADPSDLWDEAEGIIANPLEDGREWERPVTMIYWDENGHWGVQTDAGLRIHGNASRETDKKSFRLHFRSEYDNPWLRFPIFPNSDVDEFKRLVLHAGGQEFPQHTANGTLLRNQLAANLTEQVAVYATQSRPVILFLNGQLWGVYNLREYIDDRFLKSHFGIEPMPGDAENWKQLKQYVQTHDLADQSNYAYVQTQVDVTNLIDYTTMQMIMANNDWPHYNITRFRGHSSGGRWQFMFWDMDFAFGLATRVVPSSYVEYDMVDRVLNDESWFLLSALLENPDFHDRFLSRTADLLNTTFQPENVISEIDNLAAELGPDMHFETSRWPGSGDWPASVEQLRDFARRRPDIMRQHVVDGFGLEGTAVFTFNPAPSGGGTVAVNGYQLPESTWRGFYFSGTTVEITADPETGFQFVGWEPETLPQTAVITLPVSNDQTITPRFTRNNE